MTYELCIVCVRALARVQSTVKRCLLFTECASGGHFDNDEYIESYGKTYDGYIYIYIYTDALAVLLVDVGLAQARPN